LRTRDSSQAGQNYKFETDITVIGINRWTKTG
jgi:hypothetical protein